MSVPTTPAEPLAIDYRELVLTDGRVTLRPVQMRFVDAAYEAIRESLPELGRTLTWAHPGYERRESEDFVGFATRAWADGREFSWFTFDATSDTLIGGCGLNYVDRLFRRCNLGYWARSRWTGQGFTTAATRLLARWALVEHGFERVEIVVEPSNLASRRVAEKAGAQLECLARRRIRLRDQQLDAAVFSLIRDDVDGA